MTVAEPCPVCDGQGWLLVDPFPVPDHVPANAISDWIISHAQEACWDCGCTGTLAAFEQRFDRSYRD